MKESDSNILCPITGQFVKACGNELTYSKEDSDAAFSVIEDLADAELVLPLEDGELNDSVVDGNDILEAELCDSCEEDEDYVQGDVTSDESVEEPSCTTLRSK